MIRLTDLINDQEAAEIKMHCLAETIMKDVRDLTIGELSKISLTLMRNEYEDSCVPECYLPAEAINILFGRAYSLKAGIF